MTVPCRARCVNQRDGKCLLNDERIRNSQVEFGDEWDPVESCAGYIPREEKESQKRQKR